MKKKRVALSSNEQDIITKIVEKKEFSDLPLLDVSRALSQIPKHYSPEERVKLTRDLLRKCFSSFLSKSLFSKKEKSVTTTLQKHLSTRERLAHYSEIYQRIFKSLPKSISVIDLGAGINGLSYSEMSKDRAVDYVGVEAVGQLSNLVEEYFKKHNFQAQMISGSLFDQGMLADLCNSVKKPRVVLFFKVVDSLELLERNYSKNLLLFLKDRSERIILSFQTESLHKRNKFFAQRTWLTTFIDEHFSVLDDFTFSGERYFILEPR